NGCGVAEGASGPFYCPVDQKIYLDTSFLDQIAARSPSCGVGGRACQFVQAYVIAQLVGNHVQNLLGILPKAQQAQRTAGSKAQANHIQMQVQLQADCLAGIWAHHSQATWNFIEPEEAEAALGTAGIGETLQRGAQGSASPEQRRRWFSTGLRSGSLASCNTFEAA